MKKLFKVLTAVVASSALCAGIATATACTGGYNGVYEGDYHYTNQYGATYGMKVKVTVENNIITKVEDVTGDAYVTVSEGWENYFEAGKGWLLFSTKNQDGTTNNAVAGKDVVNADGTANGTTQDGKQYYRYKGENGVDYTKFVEWSEGVLPTPDCTGVYSYNWMNSNADNWTNNEAWLLQSYEGKAVSDILDIKVFVKNTGEPYEQKDSNNNPRNNQLTESGLLITGSTQGSGRLLLAVQDALSK